jgi:hypothetical protein
LPLDLATLEVAFPFKVMFVNTCGLYEAVCEMTVKKVLFPNNLQKKKIGHCRLKWHLDVAVAFATAATATATTAAAALPGNEKRKAVLRDLWRNRPFHYCQHQLRKVFRVPLF